LNLAQQVVTTPQATTYNIYNNNIIPNNNIPQHNTRKRPRSNKHRYSNASSIATTTTPYLALPATSTNPTPTTTQQQQQQQQQEPPPPTQPQMVHFGRRQRYKIYEYHSSLVRNKVYRNRDRDKPTRITDTVKNNSKVPLLKVWSINTDGLASPGEQHDLQ
jgi:hypothetical protein